MQTACIAISSVFTFAAGIPYVWDVVRGKTKPRIATWFVWAVLSGIDTAACFSDHQIASSVLTLSETVESSVIVVLGVVKSGGRDLGKLDVVSLLAAGVGTALWAMFDSPTIAVLAAVAIDLIGSVPTVNHMWRKPFEETSLTFLLSSLGGLFAFVAAQSRRMTGIAAPLSVCLLNFAFVAIITVRRRSTPAPRVDANPIRGKRPVIACRLSRRPNGAGWYKSPVMVSFWTRDGSGAASCTLRVAVSTEGVGQVVSGRAVNGAAKSRVAKVTINLDRSAPVFGEPIWSANPVVQDAPVTLRVPVFDQLSGVAGGEYVCRRDSRPGHGWPLRFEGGYLVAELRAHVPLGRHEFAVRAQDNAGNWSEKKVAVLVVVSAQIAPVVKHVA